MTHLIILLFSIQIIAANYFEELNLAANTSSDLAKVSDTSVRSSFIEADKLYKKRGVDISYAKKAIKIYQSSLGSVSNQNAVRYIQLARMQFYVGQFMQQETAGSSRLTYFQSSYENASKAAKLFNQDFREFPSLEHTQAIIYADAIYVYTMGLSQWAKLKGTFVILKKWPEIRDINQSLIDNAYGHIDYHGPYRVIGLAHNEMPPIAGGNPQIARKYLKIAFENTLIDRGFSAHMYNNIAYASRFLKDGKREEACEIVNKSRLMFKRDFEKVSPDRVPESLAEKKTILDIWLKNKCFQFEGP